MPTEPADLCKRNPGLEDAMWAAPDWDRALADGLVSRDGHPDYEMRYTPLGQSVLKALKLAKIKEALGLGGTDSGSST